MIKKGFTLIELLVVVLIIGILTAIALPKYEKAVEKTRIAEAAILVRAIANANQVFFMTNGRYATFDELDLLDVAVPGSPREFAGYTYMTTKDFAYATTGTVSTDYIALAKRIYKNQLGYSIYISNHSPNKIKCYAESTVSNLQRELCTQININGI